ncbi:Cysteinyl-tRNA synthetase [Hordeum vulgare]|nr:Cysteinyl-tRNA synthetase [Hordeum vulgare]
MEEDEPKEEDDPKIHAPGLNMTEADAKFIVAQANEMVEQQAIPYSISDEVEVEANRRLIRQRQVDVDTFFDEFEVDIAAEEAATKQPESSKRAEP